MTLTERAPYDTFLTLRGAELLAFFGYFYKEKNILGCHQVFFLEV
jgi:hypothetical protein